MDACGGVVAHVYNPRYLGGGGSWVRGQPGLGYEDSVWKQKHKPKSWMHGSTGRMLA
jgi:hypothetical protein